MAWFDKALLKFSPPILPSINQPLGALPARFRRPRLLIVGCGDVGLRVAKALRTPTALARGASNSIATSAQPERITDPFACEKPRLQVLALSSTPARYAALRAQGITVLRGNLDEVASLRRLAGLATHVLHLAPPPTSGSSDPRTQNLLRALRLRSAPQALVYGSTSAVYGDCQGAVATENRAPNAQSARAGRRLSAEQQVRAQGRRVRSSILRIPGIYAADRSEGTALDRVRQGLPVLLASEDVYTNHIHADDLARACIAALWRGKAQRVYNVNDHTRLKMGDYYDFAADLAQLPRPARLPRSELAKQLSPMRMSFMAESRQMDNTRLQRELRLRLRYPTVVEGLGGCPLLPPP